MSAGVRCGTGSQATEPAIRVMRERGLDISKHRSWELTARHAAAADLVIGMAREHVREVAVLDPSVLPRAFTLKELVRRSSAARRRTQPLVEWLEALSASRDPESLLGESHADDVDDPIGGPLREYRETAAELDDLVERLVRSAWPAG
jgi:protein-tyrosine phosphatase